MSDHGHGGGGGHAAAAHKAPSSGGGHGGGGGAIAIAPVAGSALLVVAAAVFGLVRLIRAHLDAVIIASIPIGIFFLFLVPFWHFRKEWVKPCKADETKWSSLSLPAKFAAVWCVQYIWMAVYVTLNHQSIGHFIVSILLTALLWKAMNVIKSWFESSTPKP